MYLQWELISSVYLLVSLQSPVLQHADDMSEQSHPSTVTTPPVRFAEQRWWDSGHGCKNILTNLLLILWLLLFDIPGFREGFFQLIGIMNSLHAALPI